MNCNTQTHLNMCKQVSSDLFKNNITYKLFTDMYTLKRIWHQTPCHKMQPNYNLINRIMLNSNNWNHLVMCKQMSSNSFKNKLTD